MYEQSTSDVSHDKIGKQLIVDEDLALTARNDYGGGSVYVATEMGNSEQATQGTLPKGTILRVVLIERYIHPGLMGTHETELTVTVVSDGPHVGEVVVIAPELLERDPRVFSPYVSHPLPWDARPGPADIPIIRQAADDSDPAVRWHAMRAIGRLGPDATQMLSVLARGFADADPTVRLRAVRSVRQLGPIARPLAPDLEALSVRNNNDSGRFQWDEYLMATQIEAAREAIGVGNGPTRPTPYP